MNVNGYEVDARKVEYYILDSLKEKYTIPDVYDYIKTMCGSVNLLTFIRVNEGVLSCGLKFPSTNGNRFAAIRDWTGGQPRESLAGLNGGQISGLFYAIIFAAFIAMYERGVV